MKITNNVSPISGVYGKYNTEKTNNNLKNQKNISTDKVSISESAKSKSGLDTKEIDFLKKKVIEDMKENPETRAEKIADIKSRIQSGEYKIDLDKLAEAIIDSGV